MTDFTLLPVPTVKDPRGNLSFIERGVVPFEPSGVSVNKMSSDSGGIVFLRGFMPFQGEENRENPNRENGIVYYTHRDALNITEKDTLYLNIYEKKRASVVGKHEIVSKNGWMISDYNLHSIETPFETKRVYYITEIPAGAERGGHSHFRQEVVIIALKGRFRVTVDNGDDKEYVMLDDGKRGLYVGPEVWRSMDMFEQDSVVLVLSSTKYEPSDYIYDYELFKRLMRRKKK